MSDSVTTKKGTSLPLLNLKGKKYLQVAYRIQWFTEEEPRFLINTDFLVLDDEQTVCKATIITLDEKGNTLRQAVATKRETKKDFSDHTEKAETGAIGRALIELGYGTQFALSDLDEGMRLADSPLPDSRPAKPSLSAASASLTNNTALTGGAALPIGSVQATEVTLAKPEPMKKSSFRNKPKAAESASVPVAESGDSWE